MFNQIIFWKIERDVMSLAKVILALQTPETSLCLWLTSRYRAGYIQQTGGGSGGGGWGWSFFCAMLGGGGGGENKMTYGQWGHVFRQVFF